MSHNKQLKIYIAVFVLLLVPPILFYFLDGTVFTPILLLLSVPVGAFLFFLTGFSNTFVLAIPAVIFAATYVLLRRIINSYKSSSRTNSN